MSIKENMAVLEKATVCMGETKGIKKPFVRKKDEKEVLFLIITISKGPSSDFPKGSQSLSLPS